jgi:hypothetical protein
LRQLNISDCAGFSTECLNMTTSALRNLTHLVAANVAGMDTAAVTKLIQGNGHQLVQLNIDSCGDVSDDCIFSAAATCPLLDHFNVWGRSPGSRVTTSTLKYYRGALPWFTYPFVDDQGADVDDDGSDSDDEGSDFDYGYEYMNECMRSQDPTSQPSTLVYG